VIAVLVLQRTVGSVVFGIGTDIIEVERVEEMLARGKEYLETIFTHAETDYCESKARKAEHYAARFAAKEAFLKALGTGWRDGLAFADIEIRHDALGQPQVIPHGKVKEFLDHHRITRTAISMTHSGGLALAVAILEQ
jgi:holo-[acyl-carrier protein] synthase